MDLRLDDLVLPLACALRSLRRTIMRDRPSFPWDVPINETQLRERLHHPDADTRAQWQAQITREARYDDVWDEHQQPQ